ncbi:MAG: efflux family protein [Gemmatimonadetes bacterium]|jgi:putative MATE family efflux protein|nr:efflux family protein [Gemmatimonadota bacterium]
MSASTDPLSPPAPAAPLPSIWQAIVEALRGAHGRDFTEGPIGRAIFILAVPMVLEQVMESVFAVVDVFVVAHLGADAVATVGLTESFMTMLYAMAIGVSIGAGAMISRRIGEKDAEGAAHTAAQVLLFGLAASLLLGAIGALAATHLLAMMGASAGVQANVSFTRIMLGCSASVVMLFLVNAVLRSSGDAAIAMRVLWLANGINIILAPALVLGLGPFPKLGIAGAAIGTTIGRGVGTLFALSKLIRPGSRIQLKRHHFALDAGLIRRVVGLSGSATFQVFIGMASWIGLTRILASFGSNALAGYTIGIRIVIFALLPTFGLANAAATMVGQALGARKPERAEQSVWKAARYASVFLGAVGVVFVLAARPIISVFTQEAAVAAYAVSALRTISYGFVFYAYGMVVTQSFNGAGDTRTPTWLNLFVFWMLEIPLAWVLATVFGMGPQGAFWAMTISFSVLAVASATLFRRGTWKSRMV